jgi:hypothetical protein
LADIDLPLIEKLERPARAGLFCFNDQRLRRTRCLGRARMVRTAVEAASTVFYRDRNGFFGWRVAVCAAKPGARSAKLDPILYPIAFESETLRP